MLSRSRIPKSLASSCERGGLVQKNSLRRRLAELVTVFLGVVLAFLADDFRERLADDRTEVVLLDGLRADFAMNAIQLEAQLRFNRRVETGTSGLMDLLSAAPDGAVVSVHDTLLMAAAVEVNTYDPVRGTVDAILNSGELSLIRDPALRAALAEWPAALGDTQENQRRAIDAIDSHLLPIFLDAGVPLDRVLERYRAWTGLELPSEADRWVTALPNSVEIRTVLALRARRQGIATNYIERLTEVERTIRELLGGET